MGGLSWVLGLLKGEEHEARVNGSQKLTVPAGHTLLQAALDQGLTWPHSCRVGSCGTCRCRVTKGKIRSLTDFSHVLFPEDLKSGVVLACQSKLKSDIQVEVELLEKNDGTVSSLFFCEAELIKSRDLTHDIKEFVVRLDRQIPIDTPLVSGQYAKLFYEGLDSPRSYSFAKSPKRGVPQELTFIVRLVPKGLFTEWLFAKDRAGTRMKITLPYGNFRLQKSEKPMIFIAGGSGMSGIKAILETAACEEKVARDAYFLFGARTQRDLYCREDIKDIKAAWNTKAKFYFVEVLSKEKAGDGWDGATGLVVDYLVDELVKTGKIDLAACQMYLCGPPGMINAAIAVAKRSGCLEDEIFFEKFFDSSTMPRG